MIDVHVHEWLRSRLHRFFRRPRARLRWLLRDDFNDTRAAGAVNGTAATPGPGGPRAVADDNNRLTIGGGIANFASGVGWADPGLWHAAVTRTAGRVYVVQCTLAASDAYGAIGWDNNQVGSPGSNAIEFDAGVLSARVAGTIRTVGAYTATAYNLAVILRSSGAYYLIMGGAFSNWTLLYIAASPNTATIYPAISDHSTPWTCDFSRIPDVLWNPPLLAYDTFTRADGSLGTSETAGPESQVVTARTWTAIGGDLDIASNAVTGGDAQTNLIQNPGFETGGTGDDFDGGAEIDDGVSDTFTGWAVAGVGGGDLVEATATVHAGAVAVKLTRGNDGCWTSNWPAPATVVSGALYTLTLWSRGDGVIDGNERLFDITNNAYLWNATAIGNTTAVYARYLRLFAAPTGCISMRLTLYSNLTVNGVAYLDDASIQECHADYVDVSEADVQIVYNCTTPAAGTDPFGPILRRDGATQWLVQITPGTAGTDLELIELNDGVPTSRANADVDWTASTSYEIQVSCSGDDIDVYVDGSKELSYGSGTVGQTNTQFGWFDSAEDNATLDDIQIMNKDGAYSKLDDWTS